MSLPLLMAMVVVGIAAIVIAIHLTGGTRRVKIDGAAEAAERFREDFAGEAVTAVRVTASGDAAFLELAGDRIGLVQSFGDRFLTRIISPADVIACRRIGEATVSLRLADFTLSGGIYEFSDVGDAQYVAERLGPGAVTYTAVEAA